MRRAVRRDAIRAAGSEPVAGSEDKSVIGWREVVALPDWGIEGIIAKIDTGARTSALHVENLRELPGNRVAFEVVLSRDDPDQRVPIESDLVRVTRIRTSTGHRQQRYVVSTTIRIGRHRRRVEVSLVRRHRMLCRMLLGRRALDGFLVDAAVKYLQGKRPKRPSKTGPS